MSDNMSRQELLALISSSIESAFARHGVPSGSSGERVEEESGGGVMEVGGKEIEEVADVRCVEMPERKLSAGMENLVFGSSDEELPEVGTKLRKKKAADVAEMVQEEKDYRSGVREFERMIREEEASMSGVRKKVAMEVDAVKKGIGKYGGSVSDASSEEKSSGNFFAAYVRNARVSELKGFLNIRVGTMLRKVASEDLALASYTLGTVPDAFERGQMRLRGLEAMGDAALTLAVVGYAVRHNIEVSSVQKMKSDVLSNAALSAMCVRSGISNYVLYAPGITPMSSKSSANAVEAIAGVYFMHLGMPGVVAFAKWLGIVE